MRSRDYGVFAGGVLGLLRRRLRLFFVVVVVSLPHPTNATLITHNVSRIAVNFFIDASLWVR